jgi:hypothetical protein
MRLAEVATTPKIFTPPHPKRGNRYLRTLFVQAAWVVQRHLGAMSALPPKADKEQTLEGNQDK